MMIMIMQDIKMFQFSNAVEGLWFRSKKGEESAH